jgi:hypothetical protein
MTLIQQSGDLELINLLQGATNMNVYNPQNFFNVTVLIPQQMSIQQLGNPIELSTVRNTREKYFFFLLSSLMTFDSIS